MTGKRYSTKYPEFDGIEKFVWEGLNQMGQTISQINPHNYDKHNITSQEDKDKPIWHNKATLDRFVANSLNLNMSDYGVDSRGNQLYKKIASEISYLRKKGILIDLAYIKSRNTGMGVWRLDKTKLNQLVRINVKKEMRNKNYHSSGSLQTIFVREKQNIFRKKLLDEYEKCVFCGFKLNEYMTGAHIVPYSVMRKEEPYNSMNPANGLLLCKLCDVAFERGSIGVEEDLGIEISDVLKEQRVPVIKSWINSVGSEIPIKNNAMHPPDPKYLKWKKRLVKDLLNFED